MRKLFYSLSCVVKRFEKTIFDFIEFEINYENKTKFKFNINEQTKL